MKTTKQESQRQVLQATLDGMKTQEARNVMGQFSTPYTLANDILSHATKFFKNNDKVRFLDPAFGTGSFFSALKKAFKPSQIEAATGYEIDEHYALPTKELWAGSILDFHIEDFTKALPPSKDEEKYNLIVCNPPYVRHHHITKDKKRLKESVLHASNINLSGLAGLYCYFIGLSQSWMTPNGVAIWLIPSEFMDVNYGQVIKEFLLNEVTLLQIHRFNPSDVQFNDALVSSTIVCFKNTKPSPDHKVIFTYGGSLDKPECEKEVSTQALAKETKWTRFPLLSERDTSGSLKLSDFFIVKRGIATGDNKYFVLPRGEITQKHLPISQFRPILPSPRYLDETEIGADENGFPDINNQLFVLDSTLPIEELRLAYPKLYAYLQEGVEKGVPERYLCKSRKIWYSQERRSESQFYCTYIGRSDNANKKPFRFILNHSKAIVSNSYLILYPRPALKTIIEQHPLQKVALINALNAIAGKAMLEEGRVYGGGMHKLEPKELSNVPVPDLLALIKNQDRTAALH